MAPPPDRLYARWGASHLTAFANRVLIGAGAALTVAALCGAARRTRCLRTGRGQRHPERVRAADRRLADHPRRHRASEPAVTHLPHVFGAVAQESLLIYFVHLCIVYGSVWNSGLVQYFGETLRARCRRCRSSSSIVGLMVLLAWGWNRLKHTRPRTARWVMGGAFAAGALLLLV